MKKVMVWMVAALLIFSLFGCQKVQESKDEEPKQTENKAQNTQDKKTEQGEITVSAAASLAEAMGELEPAFLKETGIKIHSNLAGSGKLQKQIEEGAPADVFISAGQKQMDALKEKNLVEADSVKNLLENVLVIVQPKDAKEKITKPEDLTTIKGKIAIADTGSVPVGQYTKQALEKLGIWDKIQDRVVVAKDVKATLAYVEQGAVEAGFVYKSDAEQAKTSSIRVEIDPSLHDPIVYPMAIVSASKNKEQAKKFEAFLKTDQAKGIFEKYGFKIAK